MKSNGCSLAASELHSGLHAKRESDAHDPCLEGLAVPRTRERNGLDGDKASVQDNSSPGDRPNVPRLEILREIVIEVQTEETARRVGPFQVVPFVFRHEELAAMSRVVVTMRSNLAPFLARSSIGASSRIGIKRLGFLAAVPEMVHDHGHEIAFVDGTLSRCVVDPEGRVNGAGQPRFDPNGLQSHLADGADSRLVFKDVGIHRADMRNRYSILSVNLSRRSGGAS